MTQANVLTAKRQQMKKKQDLKRERLEAIAAIQHEIWLSWMEYLFSVSFLNDDRSATIPAKKVARWVKQMNTSYSELSEEEKEEDRKQARKVLATLKGMQKK